jgi:hypothetical protein
MIWLHGEFVNVSLVAGASVCPVSVCSQWLCCENVYLQCSQHDQQNKYAALFCRLHFFGGARLTRPTFVQFAPVLEGRFE